MCEACMDADFAVKLFTSVIIMLILVFAVVAGEIVWGIAIAAGLFVWQKAVRWYLWRT